MCGELLSHGSSVTFALSHGWLIHSRSHYLRCFIFWFSVQGLRSRTHSDDVSLLWFSLGKGLVDEAMLGFGGLRSWMGLEESCLRGAWFSK